MRIISPRVSNLYGLINKFTTLCLSLSLSLPTREKGILRVGCYKDIGFAGFYSDEIFYSRGGYSATCRPLTDIRDRGGCKLDNYASEKGIVGGMSVS